MGKKVLFISGSLGLGHVTRDLAIARALRAIDPAIEVEWLAGEPARSVLVDANEDVCPESKHYGENTESAEGAADGFGLDLLDYLTRARHTWAANVDVFAKITAQRRFDLIVGDETYELSLAFDKRPELKTAPFVLMLDFCGLDYTTRNPIDRLKLYGWNWAWAGGHKGREPAEDMTLFVGEPDDIPDRRFGPFLPNRRELAQRFYTFVGYVFDFDPAALEDRAGLRSRLGYGPEPLIVCSIGGTAIGGELLDLCADALPLVRRTHPEARMVLVCGPRLDPATVRAGDGVTVRGYVPRLHEHFAACDLAIVQGGGTTTLELTALRRPFLFFPLEGHSEQEVAVADQARRHRAGVQLRFSATRPADLATQAVRAMATEPDWPRIATDGSTRSACALADLLV